MDPFETLLACGWVADMIKNVGRLHPLWVTLTARPDGSVRSVNGPCAVDCDKKSPLYRKAVIEAARTGETPYYRDTPRAPGMLPGGMPAF